MAGRRPRAPTPVVEERGKTHALAPEPGMPGKRPLAPTAWLPLVLVILAGLWRQGQALRLPFFADDYFFLDRVRGRSLLPALVSQDPLGNFVRPVGRQLYFWVISATGASPVAAHAVNLGLFLLILALLYAIASRLASSRAAVVAVGILALHYAADIPIRWASGSQDLLAAAGGLASLWLFLRGWRAASAGSLLLALLSKETVVLTPVVAALAARRPGEPWRRTATRAWPLFAVVTLWALFWFAAMRPSGMSKLSVGPLSVVAALAHLPQVLVGAEWRAGGRLYFPDSPASLVPVFLVACALLLAWADTRRTGAEPAAEKRPPSRGDTRSASRGEGQPAARTEGRPSSRTDALPGSPARRAPSPARDPAIALGAVWALAGALPVTVVAWTWSNYYYLFALCGLALLLGTLLARAHRVLGLAVLVGLAWGSEVGRNLDEFATAPGAWTHQSHLSRYYIDRGMAHLDRYLASMRRARPTVPPHSIIFFADIPAQVGWQAGDGPLVRWAYHDSTLQSHYLSMFSFELASRGPVFVFRAVGDSLEDLTPRPVLMRELAMSFLTGENLSSARDALRLDLVQHPADPMAEYWLGWTTLALGDTSEAVIHLTRGGCSLEGGPSPELLQAEARLAAGDTLGTERLLGLAVARHALDPGTHAALAEFELKRMVASPYGLIEAFAARLLAPQHPLCWRRWGFVQYFWGHHDEAGESLARYFALAGPAAAGDREAIELAGVIRRSLPGGELAQRAIHR
jgi:hypothetical protein